MDPVLPAQPAQQGALQQPDTNTLANPKGMVAPGNLDPWHRRVLDNGNGSFSTTLSFSIGTDKGETLIPQVVQGKLLTRREAIAHYMKTGQHLGIFASPEDADAYAQALHNAQGELMTTGQTRYALPPARYRGAFQPEKPYVPNQRPPARPLSAKELQDIRSK
jgi:hypothetical protein